MLKFLLISLFALSHLASAQSNESNKEIIRGLFPDISIDSSREYIILEIEKMKSNHFEYAGELDSFIYKDTILFHKSYNLYDLYRMKNKAYGIFSSDSLYLSLMEVVGFRSITHCNDCHSRYTGLYIEIIQYTKNIKQTRKLFKSIENSLS